MTDPGQRHAALARRLAAAALDGPGRTRSELRHTVERRAAKLSGRRAADPGNGGGLTAPLSTYIDKVALHAYRVTDGDVTAVQQAGLSDDGVFELTVAAAVGAALARLERGLAALRGEEPD